MYSGVKELSVFVLYEADYSDYNGKRASSPARTQLGKKYLAFVEAAAP
jgi:hypothetical protein